MLRDFAALGSNAPAALRPSNAGTLARSPFAGECGPALLYVV